MDSSILSNLEHQEKRLLEIVTKCNVYMEHLEHKINSVRSGYDPINDITCPINVFFETHVNNIGIGISTIGISHKPDTIVIGTGDINQAYPSIFGVYIGTNQGGNIRGEHNVGIGRDALHHNAGSNNVAIGYSAISGDGGQYAENTVAIGQLSLYNGAANNGISIGSECSQDSRQGDGAIAIGNNNSKKSVVEKAQGAGGIAIGNSVHVDSDQGIDAIAIGKGAFYNGGNQYDGAISIGKDSFGQGGFQVYQSVAIGDSLFYSGVQGFESVAIGAMVGKGSRQGNQSVAIGYQAIFQGSQLDNSIAIGQDALNAGTQKSHSITIGSGVCSATGNQMESCIAIGTNAIYDATQDSKSIAIGFTSIYQGEQGSESVSIGTGNFQKSKQNNSCIAIGTELFNNQEGGSQEKYAIAIGKLACGSSQIQKESIVIGSQCGAFIAKGINTDSILIGTKAGYGLLEHGVSNINIGTNAGSSSRSDPTHIHENYTISIGTESGADSDKGDGVITIGTLAGSGSSMLNGTIAIGKGSAMGGGGDSGYKIGAIAIGENAAGSGQQLEGAIVLGRNAGQGSIQGLSAIAIGENAISNGNQGSYSIAIGKNAGVRGQKDHSIVISASGTDLTTPADDEFVSEGGLYISPIRHDENKPQIRIHHHIFYNPNNGEVTSNPLNEVDIISGFYKDGLVINNHIVGKFDVYGILDTTSADGQGVIITDTMVLQNISQESESAATEFCHELYYNTITGEIVMVEEDD